MRTLTKNLTFVVGTGRSGSTALSRILRMHPDVLSLNELCASLRNGSAFGEYPLSGPEFWDELTEPTRVYNAMIRSGLPLGEFLYNRDPGRRYSAETTGIPAISLMTLPHLSDDPDALLDSLEPEVRAWPRRPAPDQWRALFELLLRAQIFIGLPALRRHLGGGVAAALEQLPEGVRGVGVAGEPAPDTDHRDRLGAALVRTPPIDCHVWFPSRSQGVLVPPGPERARAAIGQVAQDDERMRSALPAG